MKKTIRQRLQDAEQAIEAEIQPDASLVDEAIQRIQAARGAPPRPTGRRTRADGRRAGSMPEVTIGLVANAVHRSASGSALLRWLREFEPLIRQVVRPKIFAVGGTYAAIRNYGLLDGYEGLVELPSGRDGGMVELTRLVGAKTEDAISHVVYLIDPNDPTSYNPEAMALRRKCTVAGRVFISNYQTAREWLTWLWLAHGGGESVDRYFLSSDVSRDIQGAAEACGSRPRAVAEQVAAFVADDRKKQEALDFVWDHFDVVDRFADRIAPAGTAALLTGDMPEWLTTKRDGHARTIDGFKQVKIEPPDDVVARFTWLDELAGRVAKYRQWLVEQRTLEPGWVRPTEETGPHGGIEEISHHVRDGACQRVFIFDEPRTYDHHLALQVLERTTEIERLQVVCTRGAAAANEWASDLNDATVLGRDGRHSIVRAFADRFGVECVLTEPEDDDNPWPSVVAAAARHVRLMINDAHHRVGRPVHVGVTWGEGGHHLSAAIVSPSSDRWSRPLNARDIVPVPLIGVTGALDLSVQANNIALRLSDRDASSWLSLPYPAFVAETDGADNVALVAPGIVEAWRQLDLAILTVRDTRKDMERPLAALSAEEQRRIRGVVVGALLDENGEAMPTPGLRRIGVPLDSLATVAEHGSSVLIAGAQEERLWPCLAALRSGLVSVLITDLEFARRVLQLEADEFITHLPGGRRRRRQAASSV